MDTGSGPFEMREAVRLKALEMGFSACGFARAEAVDPAMCESYRQWLRDGNHAQMRYLENHLSLRDNPALLCEGVKTVICVALNYNPPRRQPSGNPQFACYAYGEDYHEVMREMLGRLADSLSELSPHTFRLCCDTAPVYERYWAQRSGLGFIGRNAQLIVPGLGSYHFLGELLTSLDLPPDTPLVPRCGECSRCIDSCPTGALSAGRVDARRCISCQTIESRSDEIDPVVAGKMGNRLYGCDTCQQCCPWNRGVPVTQIARLLPTDEFLSLDDNALESMTPDSFNRLFRHSAVRRAKFAGLKRNFEVWKKNNSK